MPVARLLRKLERQSKERPQKLFCMLEWLNEKWYFHLSAQTLPVAAGKTIKMPPSPDLSKQIGIGTVFPGSVKTSKGNMIDDNRHSAKRVKHESQTTEGKP